MSIKQSETSLTTDQYNSLLAATSDIEYHISAYRQNPSFDNYIGAIGGRTYNLPFTVAADDTIIIRAYNDNGSIYIDTISNAAPTWTEPLLIESDGQPAVQPKIVTSAGAWDIYLLRTGGGIYQYHSDDGVTWDTGTEYSTVEYDASRVGWLTYVGGAIPLVYLIVKGSTDYYHIVGVDATTEYDTGIYWIDTIFGFDAIDFTGEIEDSTGTHENTDARHCLVMSAYLPSMFVYKTVNGLNVKRPQLQGGIISFIVHPPIGTRTLTTSRYYPVQTFDQWIDIIQSRQSASVMATNSPMNPSNPHDTLFAVSIGHDGDLNGNDLSYSYSLVAYYSSRDGKHWSQDKIIPIGADLGLGGLDFFAGASLVRHGQYLWLISATAALVSRGCYEFNNTHTDLQIDLTRRVIDYSSSQSDARQSNILLDNRDGLLWQTFLGDPGITTLLTRVGQNGHTVQVSLEEVDSINPSRERPQEQIQIISRDRLSWLSDRIENAHAIQWDSQLSALDTFNDFNGIKDSGLAHVDTIKGNFTTSLETNVLSIRSKYSESIEFATQKILMDDGSAEVLFKIPKPTAFGGTSAEDSPSYGGIVFRALDKDNLWMVRYNYWTSNIELIERRSGTDSLRHSEAPSVYFSGTGNDSGLIGIRVEFLHGRVRVYETAAIYSPTSARFNYLFTYYMPGARNGVPAYLMGSTGLIGCGYSDQDEGETTEPEPTIVLSDESIYGPMDSFVPTTLYAVDWAGTIWRGASVTTTPSWTSYDMPGGVGTAVTRGDSVSGEQSLYIGNPYMTDAIQDPWDGTKGILLASGGVVLVDNFFTGSPTFTATSLTPLSGRNWGFNNGNIAQGRLQGSINVAGYFGWLDYPNSSGNIYYCWTTDYFATMNRTDTGIGFNPSYVTSLFLGCFGSSVSNIHVFICQRTTVKRSTNGGGSFSTLFTFPVDGERGSLINIPFALPGGGEDRLYTTLLACMGKFGTDISHQYVYFYGVGGVINNSQSIPGFESGMRSSKVGASLTIDSNYGSWAVETRTYWTHDGWATVSSASAASAAAPIFINGWPTNPDFIVEGGSDLHFTTDAGTTWTNVYPTGATRTLIQAFADFTEIYDPGGVHPA